MQAPVAAGAGQGTALLPVGLLAGFLPVYLNQKGGRRTVFVQRPPFGWDGYLPKLPDDSYAKTETLKILKQHKAYMAQFEEMLNDKEIA